MQPPRRSKHLPDSWLGFSPAVPDGELVSEVGGHTGNGASEEVSQEAAGAFHNRSKSKARQNAPVRMKRTAQCEFFVLMLPAAWVSTEKILCVIGLSLPTLSPLSPHLFSEGLHCLCHPPRPPQATCGY